LSRSDPLPGDLVAVDNGELDVHENEIGALRFGFGYPVLSVCGLDDRIA
jgi:hypothetical protein